MSYIPIKFGMSSGGNTSGSSGTVSNQIVFAGGNNITLSQSTSGGSATISISGGAGGAAGSNTFGMSNIGNTSGTSGTINGTAAQLVFAGGNNITLSQSLNGSSATITISGAAGGGGGLSAGISNLGNTSGTSGTVTNQVVFAGGDNITLSQATGAGGNTITISGAGGGGGGGAVSQRWKELYIRPILSNQTNLTAINGTALFQPFFIDGTLTVNRLNWEMSRSTSGSNHFTVHAGIYSYVNNTQISLLGSASASYSNTATASVSGIRRFNLDGFDLSTFGPGEYVLGMIFTATATASMNYSLRGAITASPQLGAILPGANSYNTATSYNIYPFWGRYTVGSSVMPASVADSQVRGQFSGASAPLGWYVGLNND